jgi:hypothetical protein
MVGDRNVAQEDVWQAAIILFSANGLGTHARMPRTGKSKTSVWRWQERFKTDGVERFFAQQDTAIANPALGSRGGRARGNADLGGPAPHATPDIKSRLIISFMISEEPPAMRDMRASAQARAIGNSHIYP